MADLKRARRQGAPVLNRDRERTPVGDSDEHRDELNANRLGDRFLSRCFTATHRPSPAHSCDFE
jgi:hypothetical protein